MRNDSFVSTAGEVTGADETTSVFDGRSLFSVNKSLLISSHEKTSEIQELKEPSTIIDRRHYLSVLRVPCHKIEQVVNLRHL